MPVLESRFWERKIHSKTVGIALQGKVSIQTQNLAQSRRGRAFPGRGGQGPAPALPKLGKTRSEEAEAKRKAGAQGGKVIGGAR